MVFHFFWVLLQTGILSPSKLRMKLMGSHHQKRSNSISSRTSPARMGDSEFAKDSLLAAENGDFGEEGLMFFPPYLFAFTCSVFYW